MSTKGFTVTWRADKREWVGKYRTPAGTWPQKVIPKDVAKGPRDRAKALAWLVEFAQNNAIPMGLEPRKRPSGRKLADTFEVWLKMRENDGRTSPARIVKLRDLFVNVVLKPFTLAPTRGLVTLGERDVVSLGADFSLLRSWIQANRKTRSEARVRDAFSALRSFFDDAIIERWFVGANPMRNGALVRELPPLPRKAAVYLPLEAVQTLLTSPRVPLARRVRYALLVTTGMREGEISGLTWARVQLLADPRRLEIEKARRLIRQKDEVLGPTKTGTSVRGLPVHAAAYEALCEWAEAEDGVVLLLGRPPMPSDPVFPSARAADKGAFTRPDTAEHLRADLEACGLPKADAKGHAYTAHALRRTFGTCLEQNKVPELVRKRLMGHGAHDVTADYYTGENFGAMTEGVATIGLTWQTGVPYDPPPKGEPSRQDRIEAYLLEHPAATPTEVAAALGIPKGTVWSATFHARRRQLALTPPGVSLVPGLVPGLVPTGTTGKGNVRTSLEPRVGLEPTTCALRKRDDDAPCGASDPRESLKVAAGDDSGSARKLTNAHSQTPSVRDGTTFSEGRAYIDVGDVRVSTDVSSGERLSAVTARLALSLRQLDVPAMAVGSGLQVLPRRSRR